MIVKCDVIMLEGEIQDFKRLLLLLCTTNIKRTTKV